MVTPTNALKDSISLGITPGQLNDGMTSNARRTNSPRRSQSSVLKRRNCLHFVVRMPLFATRGET